MLLCLFFIYNKTFTALLPNGLASLWYDFEEDLHPVTCLLDIYYIKLKPTSVL